ncbi:MAG: flippase-like domain-containing protein [Candidatus Omnitrophica bacterium]|nr:flippase-like domain-containing protein [Candidatus Omnitrophota bacterium]
MKSKLFGTILRFLISILAISLIVFFMRDKLAEAAHILRTEVDWKIYSLAIGVYFLGSLFLALRLRLIWSLQKITTSLAEVLRINFIGLFFSFFLPSAIGGDVAKIYYASQHTKDKIKASTSVVVDRLMGFVAIMIMAVFAVAFFSNEIKIPAVFISVYIFTGILLFTALFFISEKFASGFRFFRFLVPSKKIQQSLQNIYASIHDYKSHPGPMACAVLLSLTIQALIVLFYHIVCHSLGNPLPVQIFFAIVPITVIISMAPSFGGLGVREAGAIYLFSYYLPAERALALTILVDIVVYGFGLLGGIIFAIYGQKQPKMIHEMESPHGA